MKKWQSKNIHVKEKVVVESWSGNNDKLPLEPLDIIAEQAKHEVAPHPLKPSKKNSFCKHTKGQDSQETKVASIHKTGMMRKTAQNLEVLH